jgi:tetratricopeptide (TPR) repeat protein
MYKNKNLTIKETFELAYLNQQQNNHKIAESLYNEILKIDPNHLTSHSNLGALFLSLGEFQKAISSYEKVIKIDPNYSKVHYNLANVFSVMREYKSAISSYEKAIENDSNCVNSHNNLGLVFDKLGKHKKTIDCYKKAIEIDPRYVNSYNNLGVVFQKLNDNSKAKSYFKKAIEIDPTYINAYWNLHSLVSEIEEALLILKKLYKIDHKHTKTKIMISALHAYKGDFNDYDKLLSSSDINHSYTRSIKWVFSLPKLPKLFFNRPDFLDAVIKLADHSRPFYEFGVWNGYSFQYLINTFKKGFGFDTFTGLPETWHNKAKGSYSSFEAIPKIEGGEFIVGKFEDTLPDFFSKEKPKASLINFDADLYSSTLCALNYSNKVIDENTILIFDEFIMNNKWEQDEYKALNEFCDNLSYTYEVLAISFFTKQVAVKLKKN